MTVEVYEADDGWRWRIRDRNGNVLADSGEAYARRIDCVKGARKVTGKAIVPPKRGPFAARISR